MSGLSAVEFNGNSRVHMGLTVVDLAQSTEFYQLLLNSPPVKTRPGYAKFEPADPSVNLSLNQASPDNTSTQLPGHFGIQVKSTQAVDAAARRFEKAGLLTREEKETDCCYALQDKVWVTDPDGNQWEIFVVLEADTTQKASEPTTCCA